MLKYFIFFFQLVSFGSLAQQAVKVRIIDAKTGIQIDSINAQDLNNSKVSILVLQNEINLKKGINYRLSRKGYQDREVLIDQENQLILMQSDPYLLDNVVIKGTPISTSLKEYSGSISILKAKEIDQYQPTIIVSALNSIPGVYVHSGAINTNRITIRGVGSRSLFSTNQIRAFYEDIPLTTGIGETEIEDIELQTIGRLEVIKGPNSSIYGAGLGGAINLYARSSGFNEQSLRNSTTVGSFGFVKNAISYRSGTEKVNFTGNYTYLKSDGFRENNGVDRHSFSTTSKFLIDDRNDLNAIIYYISQEAFIPSSLNAEDFAENRRSAAPGWLESRANEDYEKLIAGISWNHRINNKIEWKSSLFTNNDISDEDRPFNILRENTNTVGIRSRLFGSVSLFNSNVKWNIGGEYFRENYEAQTFENQFRDLLDSIPVPGSLRGEQLSSVEESRRFYNLFLQTQVSFSDRLTGNIGFNLNQTFYTLDDLNNSSGSPTTDFNYDPIFAPSFGLNYSVSESLNGYVVTSRGFSPPTLEETLSPDGVVNLNLEPEMGWNYEFGLRGGLSNLGLFFDASVYFMRIDNLLVIDRIAEDQTMNINAGQTNHDGIEALIRYEIIRSSKLKWNARVSGSWNNHRFEDFINNEEDFSGNDLTGVPRYQVSGLTSLELSSGFYGNIDVQSVGEIPVTDGNTITTDPYQVWSLKLGWTGEIFDRLSLDANFGVNNLFDENYSSQLQINAFTQRFFYAGLPRNYYGGISLTYNFKKS